MSDNVELQNRTQPSKSNHVKYLEKKPIGTSTPLVKKETMEVQEDHSYMTNVDGNKSNNDDRSHRSTRPHKLNPKIWRDEYVTSI